MCRVSDGEAGGDVDGRKIWRLFAEALATCSAAHPPACGSSMRWKPSLASRSGLTEKNADGLSTTGLPSSLTEPSLRPRALYKQFGIEVISTTDAATDELAAHDAICEVRLGAAVLFPPTGPMRSWTHRARTSVPNVEELSLHSQAPALDYRGYLEAHRVRRAYFKAARRHLQPITAIRTRAPLICHVSAAVERCSSAC